MKHYTNFIFISKLLLSGINIINFLIIIKISPITPVGIYFKFNLILLLKNVKIIFIINFSVVINRI